MMEIDVGRQFRLPELLSTLPVADDDSCTCWSVHANGKIAFDIGGSTWPADELNRGWHRAPEVHVKSELSDGARDVAHDLGGTNEGQVRDCEEAWQTALAGSRV